MIRLLRPVLARLAARVLSDRFDAEEIRRLLGDAFDEYDRRRLALPGETAIGPRCMLHLAALTAGLHGALLERGLAPLDARRRTAQVAWLVYEKMASVPWAIARYTAKTPFARLKRATDLFRRFPFSAPSYEMVDVVSEHDVVAFDVRRCPIAEYLRAEGHGELCVEAWCNLDVPLARRWGARLERTGTLAEGADHCDFRWRLR